MSGNDEIRNANDGSKTDGTEWADLVVLYHPLFEDKKGWQDLSGEEWVDIRANATGRSWTNGIGSEFCRDGRNSWAGSIRTSATGRNWTETTGKPPRRGAAVRGQMRLVEIGRP